MTAEELKDKLTVLETEMKEFLTREQVYEVLSYGWQDHDTPDPDFFGHAIWQIDAPYTLTFSWAGNGTSERKPTERQLKLYKNGEDFIGTMDFARRSIGKALCYATIADPDEFMPDHPEFWHEYATAVQWLYIASDRLLDYFWATGVAKPKSQRNATYSSFFKAAFDSETDPTDKQNLKELLGVAVNIQTLRDDRNQIVHEIASRYAQQSMAVLSASSTMESTSSRSNSDLVDVLTGNNASQLITPRSDEIAASEQVLSDGGPVASTKARAHLQHSLLAKTRRVRSSITWKERVKTSDLVVPHCNRLFASRSSTDRVSMTFDVTGAQDFKRCSSVCSKSRVGALEMPVHFRSSMCAFECRINYY
jgi:hypothetical protein